MLSGVLARYRAEDPVLRILSTSTLFATLGRGVFLTLTTLYLGFVVHLAPGAIALVFGASSVTSIVFALIGGHLSDRISSRRMTIVAMLIEGCALAGYALAQDLAVALIVAVAQGASSAIGHSARSAIMGRAFEGAAGVRARAVLRTLTNIGIGIGSGVASIPLAFGTPDAYRTSFVVAAIVVTVAQLNLVRLPARVDAPMARGLEPDAIGGAGAVVAPVDEQQPMAETVVESVEGARSRRRAVLRAHSPWRDVRYLLMSVLTGVFAVQFAIQEVGMPLWVARDTTAPPAIVSVLLILNTVVVIAFTVPFSRGTHRLRTAGRVSLIAGGLLAVACVAYALAHGVPLLWACAALVVASIVGAFAEVLSQAGGWGLSFELADPVTVGSYQGIFGTSYALGSAVGPALIAVTAIAWGWPGWALLGVMFVLTGAGIAVIALRAASRRGELRHPEPEAAGAA